MDLFHNPSSIKSSRLETAIWVSKLVLMSMGIISILVLLKVAIIPYTFDLVLSTLPRLWISARKWLTLPFLYIIVNFIIITIAASSNFHHHKSSNNQIPFSDSLASPSDPKRTTTTTEVLNCGRGFSFGDSENLDVATTIAVADHSLKSCTHPTKPENQTNEAMEEEKEVEKGEFKEEGEVRDFGLSCNRFMTDPSPEKCINDYFLPDSGDKDDDDTLEATWRAIMEGQGKTMKPQLKKSDTWAASARIAKAEPFRDNECGDEDDPVAWAQRELKKSETFNDRASLRREKSMSPEELNRRAEAFIQKFNNQMKLQRLESYQRFIEMVNRGV